MFCPIDEHHQYRPEADMFHSIPITPDFFGPSWWHNLKLKQRWKAMVKNHPLVSDNS